jgi:hypothetical protein
MNTNVNLVPITFSSYRGIERTLVGSEIAPIKSEQSLMQQYFDYLDCYADDSLDYRGFFYKIYPFYNELRSKNVDCEIIIYDTEQICEFDGMPLDFLGYDIVNEYSESLISDPSSLLVSRYLNANGLCESKDDINLIKSLLCLDLYEHDWDTYYVYSIRK